MARSESVYLGTNSIILDDTQSAIGARHFMALISVLIRQDIGLRFEHLEILNLHLALAYDPFRYTASSASPN